MFLAYTVICLAKDWCTARPGSRNCQRKTSLASLQSQADCEHSFLDTALGYDFVMSAILAFSATHLAAETNSIETRNLAYHHRGIALNGLHNAIGNFSQENSDPILAASILLSWQAADWSGWMSLVQGISTVCEVDKLDE